MGAGLELLVGQATAPGTTFTGLTMATGNTLTVRNTDLTTPVALLSLWAFNNGAGAFRVRSPRLHDNQQGIRVQVSATTPVPRYPRWGFQQRLIPQDTLTAEITGSVTAGKIEQGALLIYYTNLPGINGRFISSDTLVRRGVNMMGQTVTITTGAVGGFSGQVAVNSGSGLDQWKANTDYALIGYLVDTNCCALRVQGIDSGNMGVGGPGLASNPDLTSYWFGWLSTYYGIPVIPVFNAANKFAILVDAAQNDGGAAVIATLFFVELMPGTVPAA
jgi:hypothetical protein